MFPKHIFKAYDIRGLVGKEVTPEIAYNLGRAFVVLLKNRGYGLEGDKVVVGYDMRESSPGLAQQVIRGITDEGMDAVDIGLVSTPVFNFACADFEDHIGGIIVTASHNPAQYNGFKITLENGLPVGKGSGMEELAKVVEDEDFEHLDNISRQGEVSKRKVIPRYIDKIFSLVNIQEIGQMKIVIDAGNGMGGEILPHVLKRLPQIEVVSMYMEPDGSFPNHEANPLKVDTLKDLQAKVIEEKANLGFASDGDADRIGLVDEKGQVVEASFAGAFMGIEVLKKHKAGTMYYDLRSSMIVPEVWQANGGSPKMCMVGHANIKNLMKHEGGIFASELSQHFYFGDMHDLESSDLALLYILRLLTQSGKPLSEIIEPLKKYYHSGEHNFEVEDKDAVMNKIKDKYKAEASEVSDLDGLFMRFDWGWLNIRKSNTEPVLRLNLEAKSQEIMQQKLAQLSADIA